MIDASLLGIATVFGAGLVATGGATVALAVAGPRTHADGFAAVVGTVVVGVGAMIAWAVLLRVTGAIP